MLNVLLESFCHDFIPTSLGKYNCPLNNMCMQDHNKEFPTLLRDEASVYFNVITVESMTSGVMSVQHQCSILAYNVLPVSFNTSFYFLAH